MKKILVALLVVVACFASVAQSQDVEWNCKVELEGIQKNLTEMDPTLLNWTDNLALSSSRIYVDTILLLGQAWTVISMGTGKDECEDIRTAKAYMFKKTYLEYIDNRINMFVAVGAQVANSFLAIQINNTVAQLRKLREHLAYTE